MLKLNWIPPGPFADRDGERPRAKTFPGGGFKERKTRAPGFGRRGSDARITLPAIAALVFLPAKRFYLLLRFYDNCRGEYRNVREPGGDGGERGREGRKETMMKSQVPNGLARRRDSRTTII